MDFEYDHIQPSFGMGVSSLEDRDIDDLCHTYLSGVDPSDYPEHQHLPKLPVTNMTREEVNEWLRADLPERWDDINLSQPKAISDNQLLPLSQPQLRSFFDDHCDSTLYQQLHFLRESQGHQSELQQEAAEDELSWVSDSLNVCMNWRTSRHDLDDLDQYLPEEPWPTLNEIPKDIQQELWASVLDRDHDTQESWSQLGAGTYDSEGSWSKQDEGTNESQASWSQLCEEAFEPHGLWLQPGDGVSDTPLCSAYNTMVEELSELDLREQFVPIKCEVPSASTEKSESDCNRDCGSLDLPYDELLKKIPSRTRKRVRGPKSWEFLMRLLADTRYNPSLIRWENEASATFRLIQPSLIAQVWAARSPDRKNLSYNNFARGLRHHYTTGALQPVMEKQLVYRCGPPALEYLRELQEKQKLF